MRALITGASSGIGRDMAVVLAKMGWDLALAARSAEQLEQLRQELPVHVEVYATDLSSASACRDLYDAVSRQPLDMLVNNAGFGHFGPFASTDLETELNLIDLNIRSVHILTKLFLQDFLKADHGIILNVASIAGFLSGPLMSSYYASKAYVLHLSEAIYEELRRSKSKVRISILCPGPVKTNFNGRAGANFVEVGLESPAVAAYAIRQALRGKLLIIPGWTVRLARHLISVPGRKMLLRIVYAIQMVKGRVK